MESSEERVGEAERLLGSRMRRERVPGGLGEGSNAHLTVSGAA